MQQRERTEKEIDGDEVGDLEHWMERYQAGELAAFERLHAALAPALGGFLRRLAPPGIEADDLVQNTFLQIHRARRSYLPGHPVKPWVYAIARNVALMARRGQRRSSGRESSLEDELHELPAPALAEANVVDRVSLATVLTSLPDAGREALWLHHVEGLSFREVAAVQGVRESAAKVRAHRALASLRGRFAPGEAS